MSYITRCPACGTAFRVVPDQLKLSEGWVRCGHCQEVFDASASLQAWPLGDMPTDTGGSRPSSPPSLDFPAQVTAPVPVSEPTAVSGSTLPATSAPAKNQSAPNVSHASQRHSIHPDDVELEFDPDWMAETSAAAAVEPKVPEWQKRQDVPDLEEPEDAVTAKVPLAPEPEAGPEPQLEPGQAREPTPEISFKADSRSTAELEANTLAYPELQVLLGPETAEAVKPDSDLDPAQSLSFVKQAQRRAFWRRPAVRAVLSLVAMALFTCLAGFWAVVERDRLAAWQPTWQPALQALCRPIGCELAPLQQIESVLIDGTALLRRSEGRYAFDVTLRNTGRWPVAVPALELTLTDIADQVLVRRVFTAADWAGNTLVLSPGTDLPLRLELGLEALEARTMTGYRALLFYP